MSTQEVRYLIVDRLIGISAITDIVDDRITDPDSIPSGDLKTAEMPRIILDNISGNARWHGAVQTQIIHVYTWSRTSRDEAEYLYRTIFDELHHSRLAIEGSSEISTRGLFWETERPEGGYVHEVNASFMRGTWKFVGTR